MVTVPICFLDTETTGLSLDDDIWEIAAIRREPDGQEARLHLFVEHDPAKCARLPRSFHDDHRKRWVEQETRAVTRVMAAAQVHAFTDGAHIVGAVPNFDTERLGLMITAIGSRPLWHYHLIDVENLTVGYLAGLRAAGGGENGREASLPSLPWSSDDLSLSLDINPDDYARHTAMGDVEWAAAIYDKVMGNR